MPVAAVRLARARIGSFRPQLDEDPRQVRCQFHFPRQLPEPAEPTKAAWEHSERLKEEEFTRAITLGLFDYLRKSRSHGFVVSLSGGADSSATATLCALMVRMGWRELGGRFVDKLAYIPKLTPPQACSDDATVIAELTNRLLLCAYQATDNSSPATRAAAVTVAKAIGAAYLELEIQSIVDAYVALVSDSLGRPLTWERDDIALQNIQARARGPSIWMFANLRQSLLLATSNRSEAAVGYATMDGDTCGGLSPIAGIDKAFLRRWLAWMETDGPQGGHPLPALSAVTRLAPTAELRPLDKHQTDEEDLMPYDLLDAIERAAIRDKQTPIEAFEKMRVLFPQYAISQLVTWIERFYTLWARNQWKRERYAPSFHVDDENLDPKTWCRFPILSGGFVRELRELRQYVDQLA